MTVNELRHHACLRRVGGQRDEDSLCPLSANVWGCPPALASAGSHPVSPLHAPSACSRRSEMAVLLWTLPQRLLGPVLVGVCFGGFVGEMRGVEMVGVGDVRVMRGFFVSTGVVMFRGFLVMTRRVFVMFRRFSMMLCRLL